jgi:hypothetical protein
MVFKWINETPQPPYERFEHHEAFLFNRLVVLGASLSADPAHPGYRAYVRGDLFRSLGYFPSLSEAKAAAENWFRIELLGLHLDYNGPASEHP